MTRLFVLAQLACCVPLHQPGGPGSVSIETIPPRTLSVQEASIEIWRSELRPAYRPPTEAETETVAALVPELLRAARTHDLEADAAERATAIGMRIERWRVAGTDHLVLSELADQRHGAGAYLFSLAHAVETAPWLLWEAPHPYFDQRTGDIAAALYFNPPSGPAPAAFFTSSLHRYTQTDGKREKRAKNPADPCHNDAHLLNVATQAAAGTFAEVTVVQLHGFANTDDEGNRPPDGALAVLSGGAKDAPTPLSTAAAARLANIFGPNVLLYPTQSPALGATTNVEMVGLRGLAGARFLHVEMAGALRDLLVQDPSRRDAFGAALFALATDPQPQP